MFTDHSHNTLSHLLDVNQFCCRFISFCFSFQSHCGDQLVCCSLCLGLGAEFCDRFILKVKEFIISAKKRTKYELLDNKPQMNCTDCCTDDAQITLKHKQTTNILRTQRKIYKRMMSKVPRNYKKSEHTKNKI